MAKATYAKPEEPKPEGEVSAWTPDPGNAISTVVFERVTECQAQFEHPESWTAEQVKAAVKENGLTIGPKLEWWRAPNEDIELSVVKLGEPAEGEFARREPIVLSGKVDEAEAESEIIDEEEPEEVEE